MKVRHQKRKCRTNEERLLHILKKQRWLEKTDIRHADLSRGVVAYFIEDNRLCTFEPNRIDDEDLIEEGFEGGSYNCEDYYSYALPINRVIGWHYLVYNPYEED